MGFIRKMYREARDILGMKPPPENATQRAERVCDEVKSEIGGKKAQHDEDYFLTSKYQGRETKILFEAESGRAVIQIASELEGGPLFVVVSEQSEAEVPAGAKREKVASGVFAQGPARDVKLMVDLWKALPTGTRGNITSTLARSRGSLSYEDGVVRLEPETETMEGLSAKSNVLNLVKAIYNMTAEMEEAWSQL